uniref:Putative secreted protein n=1 Tax=Lutzomyia longipalpis TaxID=7200 RepID=A0A7G3ALS1_LUTLO
MKNKIIFYTIFLLLFFFPKRFSKVFLFPKKKLAVFIYFSRQFSCKLAPPEKRELQLKEKIKTQSNTISMLCVCVRAW